MAAPSLPTLPVLSAPIVIASAKAEQARVVLKVVDESLTRAAESRERSQADRAERKAAQARSERAAEERRADEARIEAADAERISLRHRALARAAENDKLVAALDGPSVPALGRSLDASA